MNKPALTTFNIGDVYINKDNGHKLCIVGERTVLGRLYYRIVGEIRNVETQCRNVYNVEYTRSFLTVHIHDWSLTKL